MAAAEAEAQDAAHHVNSPSSLASAVAPTGAKLAAIDPQLLEGSNDFFVNELRKLSFAPGSSAQQSQAVANLQNLLR